MSPENRRANSADEMAWACHALRAAENLLADGLWGDAAARAYYAAYHAVRAVLFREGLEARTHKGTILLFHDLAARGMVPAEAPARIEFLHEQRILADYTGGPRFPAEKAREAVEAARGLVELAGRLVG